MTTERINKTKKEHKKNVVEVLTIEAVGGLFRRIAFWSKNELMF